MSVNLGKVTHTNYSDYQSVKAKFNPAEEKCIFFLPSNCYMKGPKFNNKMIKSDFHLNL